MTINLSFYDEEACLRAVFQILRMVKQLNPNDLYFDNYMGMLKRYPDFYDSYMLMHNIAIQMRPKRILEIGTRTGISLCQLLSAYLDTSAIEHIVCVDIFNDDLTSPTIVMKNLQYFALPYDNRLEIIKGDSKEVIPKLVERGLWFDYILVDGDHDKNAARIDLENVIPLIAPEGIIVFDDISTAPGECALIDVWTEWTQKHAKEFTCSHRMEGKGVGWAIKNEITNESIEVIEPVEPIAVEPIAVEPIAVEPIAVEPIAVEPIAVEPIAVEPIAVEPIAVVKKRKKKS